jgi:glycosyltransferase involved in cell wall biosynthesis
VLAGLYTAASLFVYPSYYEGFGIPPLEAMSFDCPVACSNTSSIPEVVGDAARYFDPTNIDSMRAVIEEVLGSAEIKATLVARGRERIKRFSWDRCAAETIRIYRELAR